MNSVFFPQESAEELDPDLAELVSIEDRRQIEKIILIPSESMAPPAVREMMASSFGNIYAEGYPRESSRRQTETELFDIQAELAYFRRHSDPRYYKGVELADILEAVTRRRAANLFSANGVNPDDLFVNVQPLSGSPANAAVYSALLEPGDTLMGLDLIHGGHLTHGSKVSRSGKVYRSVPYYVDLTTERLDYDAIEAQAMEVRPKVLVAGYTAYPMIVDWHRFRSIADKCGAFLLADIAHISGLVAAGMHPSPIGIADIVTTTTHKSLCGPRGAMIFTHRADLARLVDRAVFPGEQGGPHLNTIAALAVALKIAGRAEFRELQKKVVSNARRLAERIQEHGIRIVAGGTENHLLLLDMKSIESQGVHLSGDYAARILDIAGIVTNSNTIPGDRSAFSASGVRLGTVWISQLGYGQAEVDLLADAIATVLKGCKPYYYTGRGGKKLLRSKISSGALSAARQTVARLTSTHQSQSTANTIHISGEHAGVFLNEALTSDVIGLTTGSEQPTFLIGEDLKMGGQLTCLENNQYRLSFVNRGDNVNRAAAWLRDLSDGYVDFGDLHAKLPGPVVVSAAYSVEKEITPTNKDEAIRDDKPHYVGCQSGGKEKPALPEFAWKEPADAPLRRTALYDTHVKLGGRMIPFGGWEMPVWYSSVGEEHLAVRTTAGLFDVSHMGVLEVSGPFASYFLDYVTTNEVSKLEIGHSHYSYLLTPDGNVVDDLLIYRRDREKYMLVVNASNNDKDWAWLNAVNEGSVRIDNQRPWSRLQHQATLRDLRDPVWGQECLVDIAVQGPRSIEILVSLSDDPVLSQKIKKMPWASLVEGELAGIQTVISRTGYTGERIAFELFVHPDNSPKFWEVLMEAGKPFGMLPCGLASRDSTRTEAGLPLYGHELNGLLGLNPAEAGFASYVKVWKPFFVGRSPYIEKWLALEKQIVRFRMVEKGVRRPELGDPVLDKRGKVVGMVTSCAIDGEGYLLGQAAVPLDLAERGTQLSIYQLGGGTRKLRVPDKAGLGARLPKPDLATVLDRFPKKQK